jgi:hypothetical protein
MSILSPSFINFGALPVIMHPVIMQAVIILPPFMRPVIIPLTGPADKLPKVLFAASSGLVNVVAVGNPVCPVVELGNPACPV